VRRGEKYRELPSARHDPEAVAIEREPKLRRVTDAFSGADGANRTAPIPAPRHSAGTVSRVVFGFRRRSSAELSV